MRTVFGLKKIRRYDSHGYAREVMNYILSSTVGPQHKDQIVWHHLFLWDSGDTISLSKSASENRSKRS